jgi:hypothetical protein
MTKALKALDRFVDLVLAYRPKGSAVKKKRAKKKTGTKRK